MRRVLTGSGMLEFLNRYAKNLKYSQNGEEGIILECLQRLGIDKGHAVEIGGHDGLYCSNTALLLENGWSGLFVEAEYERYLNSQANWRDYPNVRSQCCKVDERNVNAFVGECCDVFSTDTDGSDYRIFSGLKARPKIVIVEIDSSIEPPSEEFNSDGAPGYWPMTVLGLEKGYFLLCHTGNLIFVREEYKHLFPEINKHPLIEWEYFFNRAWVRETVAQWA